MSEKVGAIKTLKTIIEEIAFKDVSYVKVEDFNERLEQFFGDPKMVQEFEETFGVKLVVKPRLYVAPNVREIRVAKLEEDELKVIDRFLYDLYLLWKDVNPYVAAQFLACEPIIVLAARHAKAIMNRQKITREAEKNTITITVPTSRFIKYSADAKTYLEPNSEKFKFELVSSPSGLTSNVFVTYLLGGSGATDYWSPPRTEGERFVLVTLPIIAVFYDQIAPYLIKVETQRLTEQPAYDEDAAVSLPGTKIGLGYLVPAPGAMILSPEHPAVKVPVYIYDYSTASPIYKRGRMLGIVFADGELFTKVVV